MDEILKKIDEAIMENSDEKSATIDYETGDTLNTFVRMGLNIAKEIILSQQKPLTIGDKIRESNESLVEFIENIVSFCSDTSKTCDNCPICTVCGDGLETIDYLNQPPNDNT
jgi:hypothetical protein